MEIKYTNDRIIEGAVIKGSRLTLKYYSSVTTFTIKKIGARSMLLTPAYRLTEAGYEHTH